MRGSAFGKERAGCLDPPQVVLPSRRAEHACGFSSLPSGSKRRFYQNLEGQLATSCYATIASK